MSLDMFHQKPYLIVHTDSDCVGSLYSKQLTLQKEPSHFESFDQSL